MRKMPTGIYSLGLVSLLLLAALPSSAQVSVTMQHNDLSRTGQNLNETTLTKAKVNVNTFGLLFKNPVDGQVYSQPLVLANVSIGGGTHNVVYVATTNNSVYAFDADTGAQYWHFNFGTPISNANYGTGCVDINGNAGIVGTPVIDPSLGTLFVVNSLNSGGAFSFRLHALDVTTGADKAGSPVQITASGFSALLQNARAALTVTNGNVLIPFSSHCDMGAYHGFLFAYNESSLAQVAVFNTSPTSTRNALWMSGQGPSVDSANNIYFGTSNGSWDGVSNFSESFIKLSPSLALLDWFTAANHSTLDGGDGDLDTSGPLLIPGANRMFMVGKSKTGYVINTANLGHLGDASAVQTVVLGGGLHGSAVYFNSPVNGPEVYTWAVGDTLKAFQFNGSDLNLPNFQAGPEIVSGNPAAFLSISANGNTDGIVWANAILTGDANHNTVPGVLRAYDADNIATELYNNQQNATRDTCNNFAKNGYVTIANGKVYVPSFGTASAGSGQLCVYGIISGVTCTVPTTPSGLTATAASSTQINLSWTASTSNCSLTYNVFRSTTSGVLGSQIASGVSATSYSDTTAACATTYFYQVEATNSGGTSAASNQASATTLACGAPPTVQINAGGPAVTPFAADQDFTGGTTINHANTIDLSGVTNPAPMAVYQTARVGTFTYTIPGYPAGSSNTVRLHFAETYFSAAGSRVFNVSINGTQVLTNFDIFVAAGNAKNKAVIEQFTENASSSGQYVLQFTTVTNSALVSGIETLPGGGPTCSAAPTAPSGLTATAVSSSEIDLSWTASTAPSGCTITYTLSQNGTPHATGVSGTSFKDTGLACNTAFTYTVAAVDSFGSSGASNSASATTSTCPPPGVQINSGGPAVSPFVADVDFAGGGTINHANTIDLSKVTNPAPMAVYQTGRDGNFTYTIPGFTAGSSHLVRLHFAETYWGTSGSRIFNVSINGTAVLTNFDIFATAGGKNIANIQQFTENANSSGQYVIQFTTVKDNSLVSGIEIQ